MGKDGFLTAKAIANRIKSKGLQKLRWYCQMCEKQCRDENGFKCHINSESHQRQMLLFSENSGKILNTFSSEFKNEFVTLLRRRYGTRRVHANLVYQEYISDRNHLHMNATSWHSLTDFVKHLGKESICHVEDTEKGWFITYIDRDPDTVKKQEMVARQERLKKDEDDWEREVIEKQIERARQQAEEVEQATPTELVRTDNAPLKLGLSFKAAPRPTGLGNNKNNPLAAKGLAGLMKSSPVAATGATAVTPPLQQQPKKSQVEALMERELERKERTAERNRLRDQPRDRDSDHRSARQDHQRRHRSRSRSRSRSPASGRSYSRDRDRARA
ncbi:hypothetical protein RI367_003721 [Sorochytrium milnesiophthora]